MKSVGHLKNWIVTVLVLATIGLAASTIMAFADELWPVKLTPLTKDFRSALGVASAIFVILLASYAYKVWRLEGEQPTITRQLSTLLHSAMSTLRLAIGFGATMLASALVVYSFRSWAEDDAKLGAEYAKVTGGRVQSPTEIIRTAGENAQLAGELAFILLMLGAAFLLIAFLFLAILQILSTNKPFLVLED